MIQVPYFIQASTIPGAGKGFFLDAEVRAGQILLAPVGIARTYTWQDLAQFPADSVQINTSVRWFEEAYALDQAWNDTCFINHSFQPNGLVHLGFVIARENLPRLCELTVDYRHMLGSGFEAPFPDGTTGKPIVGFPWSEAILRSTRDLLTLLSGRTE
jgi:hypothetical protein